MLGSVLPGTRVVVASAVMQPRGDLSFGSVLVRLEAGQPARQLVDRVAYGSRPLVTTEGRVFVSRGRAGNAPDPVRGAMRVDALTIDEVEPRTGRARVVYSTEGFVTFLAGAVGRELIIYEVHVSGARVFALHQDTGAVRSILPTLVPMARDFVVDAPRGRVLFTQSTAAGWEVQEVSLTTGATQVLAKGPEVTLLPTVLSDGRVLVSAGRGEGLRALDGGPGLASHGAGFERVRFEHQGLLLGLLERPSEFPSVFVSGKEGVALRLEAPVDARLDLAGVLP